MASTDQILPRSRSWRAASAVAGAGVMVLAALGPVGAEAFPGDNGKISFSSERDGKLSVFTMSPDGSGQAALTAATATDEYPAWSPDGTRIAYISDRAGNPDIYIMNADGSGDTPLTATADNESAPTWSPDGKRIAFTVDGDIYAINVDGTGRVNLTNSVDVDEAFPTWSPDGTKIAFHQTTAAIKHDVYVMNADGSGRLKLTSSPDEDVVPSWSPDGSQIAFSGWRGDYDIFVMDADGSNERQLTDTPGTDSWPAWSPDGAQIAFTSTRDGDEEVYVMDADGSAQTRLTTSPGDDKWPAWQPLVTPSAPRSVAASPGDARIAVSWLPPASAGTYPVSGYKVSATSASGGEPVTCTTAGATGCTVAGLVNGTRYRVSVTASNAVGAGPASDPVFVTPLSPATSPTTPPATPPGSVTLRVKALKKSRLLRVGKRYVLVRRVSTNAESLKTSAICRVKGKKVRPAKQKRVCGLRVVKPTTAVRVIARPKCSTRVSIRVRLRARTTGLEPVAFSRQWRVKRLPRVDC